MKDAVLNKLTSLLFYISILFFILGFNFSDNPLTGGWYQQFMPDLGGRSISDITFSDSLTGYAVASQTFDSSFILRTVNGGNNWQIIYGQNPYMTQLQFLNFNTGYTCGSYIYKTTNGGFNWSQLNMPSVTADGIFALSQDTIWFVGSEPFTGGVYRTTNGGVSWQSQLNIGSSNPDRIYMYNRNIGFISRTSNPQLRKTTDGGLNWNLINGIGTGAFNDMYFIDSLTGWKAKAVGGGGWIMGKTTDGGYNWAEQILPSGGNIINSQIKEFSNVNKDTIWGVGGDVFYPSIGGRGILYRTTNGGSQWLYQIPDTGDITINVYFYTQFTNKLNGWAYHPLSGIHTATGGDTIFLVPVIQVNSEIPKSHKLFQNYPNPFNPKTVIRYQITTEDKKLAENSGQTINVKIIIYDIRGREIARLSDTEQSVGTYEVEFSGDGFTSGIYFYSLIIDGKVIDTKKMILLK